MQSNPAPKISMADTTSPSSDDLQEEIEMKRSTVSSPINIPWMRKESSDRCGFAASPDDSVPSFSSSYPEIQTPEDTLHYGNHIKETSSADFASHATTPEGFDGVFNLENLPTEAREVIDHLEGDVPMDEQFPDVFDIPKTSAIVQIEAPTSGDAASSEAAPIATAMDAARHIDTGEMEAEHAGVADTEASGLYRRIGRQLAMVGDSLDAASQAYHAGDRAQVDGRNGILPGRNGVIDRRRHL